MFIQIWFSECRPGAQRMKAADHKRKTAMNGIGYEDVESYVRTLISEGFGKQLENEARGIGHSEESGSDASVLEPDQPD